MAAVQPPDLIRLDLALLALRRLLDAPTGGGLLRHDGRRVDVSTMLVVDAVARAEVDDTECSIGDVAAVVQVAHSTASRLVDRAAQAGMVERARSRTDPRRTRLELTEPGRQLQHEAVHFRTDRLAGILAGWSTGDVSQLADLLVRFATDARRTPPARP